MDNRGETRRRMVETAMRLFRRSGYEATSWRALVEQAGTPWGSVHHHFPKGKTQLGVAAITLGAEQVEAAIEHCFARSRTPGEAVRRWCKASADQLAKSNYEAGCPVATVALEVASSSKTLSARCRKTFGGWQALLAGHLVVAGAKSKRARDLAAIVVAGVEGALLLSRVQRTTAPLTLTGDWLQKLLDDECRL